MWRLVTGFLLFYLANMIGGAAMSGFGGVTSVRLTQNLTAVGTTINVVSTSGMLYSDYVTIDKEEIRYTSKTATTIAVAAGGRGYNGTAAATHSRGSWLYNSNASIWNNIVGFNLAATDTDAGGFNLPIFVWNFLFKSLPKLLTWDFPQFMVNQWAGILRWVFVCFSAGMTVGLVIYILSGFGGVSQQILTRL